MENEIKKKMQDYAKNQNLDPKFVNEYTKKIDVKKSNFLNFYFKYLQLKNF